MQTGFLGLVHAPEPTGLPCISEVAYRSSTAVNFPDWTRSVASWGTYLNLTLGTCSIAGVANTRALWGAYTSSERIMADSEVVPNLLSTGGNPQTGTTVDALMKTWYTTGFSIDGVNDKIIGYASIDPENHEEVMECVQLFGVVGACWNLPGIIQTQQEWGVGGTGDTAAGSLGGHYTVVPRITDRGGATVTWGEMIDYTWDFWDKYITRAVVPLSLDWISNNSNPAGVNFDALERAMKGLT